MCIRIGANPIGWTNDDLQDIGGDVPVAVRIVGVTYVERGGHASGDDVCRARQNIHCSDGCNEIIMRLRVVFDCDDPLRCGGHRVLPHIHGRRAGMIGLTGEDELHASLTDECADDSKRSIFAFKDWSLLNMKLQIGEGFVGQGHG